MRFDRILYSWFYKSLLIVLLIVLAIGSIFVVLEVKPPAQRPEFINLVTLFAAGSPQEYFFKRTKILSDQHLVVAAHGIGNPRQGIQWVKDANNNLLSVKQLADVITQEKQARGLDESLPVYLMACNAGAGKNSYAAQLSQVLDVPVTAPTEWLVVDHFGMMRTGQNLMTAFFNFGHISLATFFP